jgi:hypothetical protein
MWATVRTLSRTLPSGIIRSVAWKKLTEASEENIASIFGVESKSSKHKAEKMQKISSFEPFINFYQTTRCTTSEDNSQLFIVTVITSDHSFFNGSTALCWALASSSVS